MIGDEENDVMRMEGSKKLERIRLVRSPIRYDLINYFNYFS